MTPRFLCFHMAAVLLTALSPWAENADVPHVAILPAVAAASVVHSDTVRIAPPTGEQETDRANVQAAFDAVQPDGTVLFAPGTYLIGEIIHVTVPGITVLGHPDGTTLRGCHPDMFPRQGGMEEMFVAVVSCNGLDMAGDHQTVRGLTFEYAWHALVLGGMECMEGRGCVPVLQPVESRSGGYRVEDNTFRNTAIGIRTLGQWSEPAVIRGNRFINTLHAVVVHGSIVHVVENDISVPEPERVPAGHPGTAVIVSATDLNLEAALLCAGNVIAGNRIRGHPDGIAIMLLRTGVSCRDNVIRQNTIAVARVQVTASWWGVTHTESDSSAVGVPMALINAPKADPKVSGSAEVDEQEGVLEGNLVEGNTVSGAEGIGIELLHASGNRIVNNTITGVARRDPFPGITVNSFDPQKSGWREANGSGVWVSPGSDENEIVGNTFEDVEVAVVFLEGDDNRVFTRSPEDEVRDRGTGNEVTVADSAGTGDRSYRQPSASPVTTGTDSTVVPDTSEILDAAEAFLGAFNRLEWEPFRAAFSPDATVFQPFGEPFRNDDREEISAFFRSFFDQVRAARDGPPYLDIVPEDLRIEPLGEAAVVTFHLSGDREVGRRTLVFDRDEGDGSWRIAHLHASSLERPGQAGGEATPPSRELDAEAARRYVGRYALSLPDGGRMAVTFRVGDEGLEAELGGSARELGYLGGHTFVDVDAGYLFVFNVERDGRAVGITGLPPGRDRVEVFDRVEESQ